MDIPAAPWRFAASPAVRPESEFSMIESRQSVPSIVMPKAKEPRSTKRASEKPTYFLVYSTGEPQIKFFIECLEIVFGNYFRMIKTPDDLVSDKSQHDAIMDLIGKCAFGVVCLDGLRPNVVFEYGALRGAGKPVLLFKEISATVDVGHFYGGVKLLMDPPPKYDTAKDIRVWNFPMANQGSGTLSPSTSASIPPTRRTRKRY